MANRGKHKSPRRARRGSAPRSPEPAASASTTAAAQPRWMHWAAATAIVILGCIAFSTSFQGTFLFDDITNIVDNAAIRGADDLSERLRRSYRPVVDLTFALNVRLTGAAPGDELPTLGFHIVNLLIHLAAGLALFGVVRRTLLLPRFNGRFRRSALWIAFAIAAIWTVHPLQTQSVTYIVQRAESLMGLCYLLTFYGYIRGATAQRMSWRWYAVAVIAALIGMMSKAVMVTAPVLLVLYELCFFRGRWTQRLRARGPVLGAVAATWLVMRFTGVARGVLDPTRRGNATVGFAYQQPDVGGATWWHYLLTQSEVILHYLRLSVWPHPLMLDYAWPMAESLGAVALPFAAISALGLVSLYLLWKRPPLGFVAAALFIILGPTSSVVPIKDVTFEHRMYLPLAAVIALVVLGVNAGLNRLSGRGALRAPTRHAIAALLFVCVVAPLTTATIVRNMDYHDQQRMWRDVYEKHRARFDGPGHPRAMNNLATQLILTARDVDDPQQQRAMYREAAEYLQRVIEIGPDQRGVPMSRVHYNMANCLVRLGRVREALPHYQQAVALRPVFLEGYIMYGNALSRLNRPAEAVEQYNHAIHHGRPDRSTKQAVLVARAYYNRGNQYANLNDVDMAIESFAAAARTSPAYAKAYFQLGRMYERTGDPEMAAQSYRYLLRAIPDHAAGRQRLGNLESRGY